MDNEIIKFGISNSELPKIMVNGEKFHIVNMQYIYRTSDADNKGIKMMKAEGYVDGSCELKVIYIDEIYDMHTEESWADALNG